VVGGLVLNAAQCGSDSGGGGGSGVAVSRLIHRISEENLKSISSQAKPPLLEFIKVTQNALLYRKLLITNR